MRPIDADWLIAEIKRHNNMSEMKPTWRTKDVVALLDNCPVPPNPPLTLSELREMDGEPVFVNLDSGYWGIVDCEESVVAMSGHGVLPFAVSGGRCYRRKPEEGAR